MDVESPESEQLLVEEYKNQGNSCYKQGMYNEAIAWYTKGIEIDSTNVFLYNNRSAAYLMINKPLDAYKDASRFCFHSFQINYLLDRSISLDSQNVKSMLRCLKCCLILGDLNEAKRLCSMALHLITKCIELAPASLSFNLQKLNILIQLKRFSEAKILVENLLHSHSSSVDLLFYRGLCLYYLDHLDKAIVHFQHVLRLHPDHIETQKVYKRAKNLLKYKEEGNTFIHDHKYSQALEAYTKALEVDPSHDMINAKLYCNRACALFYLDRFDEALNDCDNAISLEPNYLKARIRRARCYSSLEEYEKAVEEWTAVVKLDGSQENKKSLQAAKSALSVSQRDYYKILGLKKNASSDDIKQAYRKSALLYHPDRHTSADEATVKEKERKFKEIGEAYSILSDPVKRRQYDNGELSGDDAFGQGNVSAHNLFTQVFPGFGTSTVHFYFG
ncbi:DnaJ subfamily C member 7 [Schistosoma bovis]|uniref:DnaJ subfamily C member 7 n=1 Tax=Schistosoma bovis TaxID=6184 RepID=A0A430Q0Q0_SCHBO|nr:DnaJ subfamily C member 7 [Schistosoma bovis]